MCPYFFIVVSFGVDAVAVTKLLFSFGELFTFILTSGFDCRHLFFIVKEVILSTGSSIFEADLFLFKIDTHS